MNKEDFIMMELILLAYGGYIILAILAAVIFVKYIAVFQILAVIMMVISIIVAILSILATSYATFVADIGFWKILSVPFHIILTGGYIWLTIYVVNQYMNKIPDTGSTEAQVIGQILYVLNLFFVAVIHMVGTEAYFEISMRYSDM
jgi:hypothetical protein